MKQEINLEKIISSYGILEFGGINQQYIKNQILMAMKEACSQCLDLAAEGAYVRYIDLETNEEFDYTDIITDDGAGADVSKQSILQIKDWIK